MKENTIFSHWISPNSLVQLLSTMYPRLLVCISQYHFMLTLYPCRSSRNDLLYCTRYCRALFSVWQVRNSEESTCPQRTAVVYIEWLQCEQQAQVSTSRRIIGYLNNTSLSDNNCPVRTHHLVMEGFSIWMIGRNLTRLRDIRHHDGCRVVPPSVNNV